MQRIITAEEQARKDKRSKIVIGVVMIALMTLSTAGYAFFNNERISTSNGKISQNGVDFYDYNGLWQTTISGQAFYFTYLPNETSDLKITKTLNDYNGKPLYLTQDSLASQEITRNIGRYAERIQLACMKGENCTENLPEKNCSSNIIIIQDKTSGSIVQEEGSCIYIFSNDTIREADAFVYKVLGIK